MTTGLRERRKQGARQAISGIAMEMFAARGFDEVTISQVADAAGVSKMTVTNYFPRKEDLVFDRAEGVVRSLAGVFATRAAGESLLAAIRREKPPVLLVDEVDRADEEFEAFLLELLSDFQISIPELGTVKATSIPRVVLTSNGTRELSDALRRRCLFHYVDFPDVEREARIILTRTPGIDTALTLQIARMVAAVRKEDLRKVPGVAETLDWAATLAGLEIHDLRQEPEAVHETMICLIKTREDRSHLTREVTDRLLGKVA